MANILVVDDDEIILKVVKAILVKANHTVCLAKNGHEALDILERELFDIIVSDISMPGGISGHNLVSTIKSKDRIKNIPIIFLTGRRPVFSVESGRHRIKSN